MKHEPPRQEVDGVGPLERLEDSLPFSEHGRPHQQRDLADEVVAEGGRKGASEGLVASSEEQWTGGVATDAQAKLRGQRLPRGGGGVA